MGIAGEDGTGAELPGLLERFSEIGRKNGTGIERLALSDLDATARGELQALWAERGLHVYRDRIGNQFGLVQPLDSAKPLVLVGSHLDSQPDGGRFDGQVGVLGALAVVCGMRDRGLIPSGVNVGAVNWTNEEGARFQPSVMGSSVFAGVLSLDAALASSDTREVRVADELERLSLAGDAELAGRVAGYAELHVEQGPRLEEEGVDIGVVDGTWAAYKADVVARGVQTHTGPTPMAKRIDALYGAARAIAAVHELGLARTDGRLHTAVAWMRITPNSPNATPSAVEFKVELRGPDEELLARTRDELLGLLGGITAESGVAFEVGVWSERRAESFDAALADEVERSVRELRLSTKRMPTIAGHDAVVMNAAGVPTTLLFVPSHDGITHNAAEFTSDVDLVNGEAALAAAVQRLCARVLAA
ncbi:Zn-dependent hydrolase [Leucobacter ruminantium]|uniref:Zn-dependent hydrolase n=1 Tax=Leucobacter ruminantium TaxID=1289170 RepID=A0A939LSH0_9MICO|nr:Zn-dependent hydrolase [Leucobacter ruminantium]MBO1803984.1 Zn-dependent hydrolase [Leucobacter ruminantium]